MIAVAGVVAVTWLGATATDVVENAVSRIVASVDRLDTRLAETVSSIEGTERVGELRVRAQGIVDLAGNAADSLGAVDDHPFYSRLPVDTAPMAALVEEVEEMAAGLRDELAGAARDEPVSVEIREEATDGLTGAQDQLAAGSDRIQDLGNQLRLWIRLSAFAGLLVCFWGLWAQVALARRGWQTRVTAPEAS